MTLPKQKKNESDADYAVRLERAKERKRKYYRDNREAQQKHSREYYHANKEARREYSRKYHEANKEVKRERNRRYHEANREAIRERKVKHYEANREAETERSRKYREAKMLASAKGKPLRPDFRRAQRPKLLTKLILKVAEDFCRNYGFSLECKWDTDVLRHAAKTIRNSPELDGAANPWYGTDYLCPAVVDSRAWASHIRRCWRNKI